MTNRRNGSAWQYSSCGSQLRSMPGRSLNVIRSTAGGRHPPLDMIYIEDEIHCEQDGPFETFEDAVAELRRRASIAWDAPPNQAPCTSWRTCGREYRVLEYNVSSESWKLLRHVSVLNVSAKGVVWIEGFEQAWAAGAA